jgi:hypothetical protein
MFCFSAYAQKQEIEKYFNSIAVKHPQEIQKLEALKELILETYPKRGVTIGTISCFGYMNAKYMISSEGVVIYFVPTYDAQYNINSSYKSIVKTRLSNQDKDRFDSFPLSADGLRVNKTDELLRFYAKEPVLLTSFVSNSQLKALWNKKGIEEKAPPIDLTKKPKVKGLPDKFTKLVDTYFFNNDPKYTGGALYNYSANKVLNKLLPMLSSPGGLKDEDAIEILFSRDDAKDGLFFIVDDIINNNYEVSLEFKKFLNMELQKVALMTAIDENGMANSSYSSLFVQVLSKVKGEDINFELFLNYFDRAKADLSKIGFSSSWGTKAFLEKLSIELLIDYKAASKMGMIDPKLEAEKSSYERLVLYLEDPYLEKEDLIERVFIKMEQDLKHPGTKEYRTAVSVIEDLVYVSNTPDFLYNISTSDREFIKHVSIFMSLFNDTFKLIVANEKGDNPFRMEHVQNKLEMFRLSINKLNRNRIK